MKSRKLFLIPFLFVFLCGMSTKNAADYAGEKISKASIVTEEYDLMNFPAVPCSYSVNEMGKVAVGFKPSRKNVLFNYRRRDYRTNILLCRNGR